MWFRQSTAWTIPLFTCVLISGYIVHAQYGSAYLQKDILGLNVWVLKQYWETSNVSTMFHIFSRIDGRSQSSAKPEIYNW